MIVRSILIILFLTALLEATPKAYDSLGNELEAQSKYEMKRLIIYIIVPMLALVTVYANPPVCTASEYAKMVCQTVYINGKPVRECKWVYLPLSGAGS